MGLSVSASTTESSTARRYWTNNRFPASKMSMIVWEETLGFLHLTRVRPITKVLWQKRVLPQSVHHPLGLFFCGFVFHLASHFPAVFQWCMESYLEGLAGEIAVVCLDDILVYGENQQEYLRRRIKVSN